MLDIQFIRDNSELVQEKAKQKNVKINIKDLLKLDKERKELLSKIEDLRAERNKLADALKAGNPTTKQLERGREVKEHISQTEALLNPITDVYEQLLMSVPNIMPDDTPLGGEDKNVPLKTWGEPKKNETLIDHQTWGEKRDLIDFERGSKVSGNKFYYLKGGLVNLELAVFQLGLEVAEKYGFTPMTVPHMVNTKTVSGTGFMPRGEEKQIYKIEGEDLNLIATAEIPITGYHSDEILEKSKLPIMYAGISPAYRMEAGAYGKHSRGLYRVHEFNKLELYVFCEPEDSEKWHEKLLDIEEELCQKLEIPYQVVRIAAGDLGAPAYKKYDVNYWSPVDGSYRELMSCSNVTDYQSRRLNIRYKDNDKNLYVHTLNATAAAFSRVCIALIENHQNHDGSLSIPKALQNYMGGKEKI